MVYVLFTPFLIQGCAMLVDEFYFHRRRGLGKWERLGHPLDTLTVLACFCWLTVTEPNMQNLMVFVSLAFFSCLFVTKDEWVHAKECPATEQWLHALLFVLHPLVFLSAGSFWWFQLPTAEFILIGQVALLLAFICYQIVYWNFMRKKIAVCGN